MDRMDIQDALTSDDDVGPRSGTSTGLYTKSPG